MYDKMVKLKPCPFCGGEAAVRDIKEPSANGWVGCQRCRCFMDFVNNGKPQAIAAWNRRAQPEITGETSDGYHTFNELYHHRAVLFSVICNDRPALAWKSKLHHDGTMYDGMFIVGIETPDGQATYHYDIEPYWEMFNVQELPQAPEWDGHTPAQAIERIGKLRPQPENKPLTLDELRRMDGEPVWCIDGEGHSCYCLVNADNEDCIDNESGAWRFEFFRMTDSDTSRLHKMGWLAYRSKPKEEV